MKTKNKSKKVNRAWLNDHVNDPYVRLAQRDGYRARAAYKLKEIDEGLGLIKPGDRIDVLAIIQPPGQRGSDIAKLVLQDVLILAVGEYITTLPARKVQKDEMSGKVITKNLNLDRNFNTITLEVDPNSAQQVLLLQSMGMGLYVMLRNNDDTERVALGASTLPEILNSGGTRGVATQR